MNELWQLARLTTGERTALKRAAGTLGFDASARRAFYRADICGEASWEDQRYAAMCMACLWNEQDGPTILPMEVCLKNMCWVNAELQEGFARKVDALLETRWERDDYLIGKILNVVRMMRQKGEFRPDFEKLAKDLRYWNSENRSVQRTWLRTIYKTENSNTQDMDKIEKKEAK